MNEDLKEAFGNDRWTAGDFYREIMLKYAAGAETVLELGTGLTTLDLARAGAKGVALEHEPHWLGYVCGVATATRTDLSADFKPFYTPLVDFGDFEWYNYKTDKIFDFVVCDGPRQIDTKGLRVGLLPVMANILAPGCLILYDDYEGPETVDGHTAPTFWAEHYRVIIEEIYTPVGDGLPFALLKVK